MTHDSAFFYQVLKPGRYLGGEFKVSASGDRSSERDIVWFYPDRYERAITDPAWRRSYFQLSHEKGIRVSRAVEYARDVWSALHDLGRPTFTLDSLNDVRDACAVVFWAPDVLTAAHIPSLVRRIGLNGNSGQIGVLCNGAWMPRFLFGHVDWIAPAPDGWLSGDMIRYLRDGGELPLGSIPARDREIAESRIRSWQPASLNPSHCANTPHWIPRVEVEEDFVDIELAAVDLSGVLCPRGTTAIVLDALNGLKATGIDGVRFCSGGNENSVSLANVLNELQRRHNMKRVRALWPEMSIAEFRQDWLGYKPHLLRPVMRFALSGDIDSCQAVDAGNRALNLGWQGLSAVIGFESLDVLLDRLDRAQAVAQGWSQSAQGHADKRPLRIEYRPSSIDQWTDAPGGPDDDGIRRYTTEFRRIKDSMSRNVAVGNFRIEDLIARNWLAASDLDLWDRLATLDLLDPNDSESTPFEWFSWVRQESGLTAPPQSKFLCVRVPKASVETSSAEVRSSSLADSALEAPSENLFGRRKQRSAPSNRLALPPLTRMRVQWAKELPWRLYSHLDLVRAIERSIRKAGLAAAYSEGFHPRLRLSFGPPLAFGLLSESEYFDLILDDDFKTSDADRLARSLPEGIRLVDARGMAAGMPALSDAINEAIYSATIPLNLELAQEKLDEFGARSEVSWQRIGREDRRPVDPRKTLRNVSVESGADGTRWQLNVLLGAEGNIRPTDWAMLLFGFSQQQLAEIVIQRTALNIRRGSSVRTPFDPI